MLFQWYYNWIFITGMSQKRRLCFIPTMWCPSNPKSLKVFSGWTHSFDVCYLHKFDTWVFWQFVFICPKQSIIDDSTEVICSCSSVCVTAETLTDIKTFQECSLFFLISNCWIKVITQHLGINTLCGCSLTWIESKYIIFGHRCIFMTTCIFGLTLHANVLHLKVALHLLCHCHLTSPYWQVANVWGRLYSCLKCRHLTVTSSIEAVYLNQTWWNPSVPKGTDRNLEIIFVFM